MHGFKCFLAFPFEAAVDALRLVHDQDGPGSFYQVDGLFTAGFFAVLVEVVDILFVDGTHRYHHNLNIRAGGKVAYLAQLGRVVDEVVERHAGIEALEVLFGDLQSLVHTLLDGHRGHHDHELGKAVALVELEDGAQINIGLARSGLHLHREVARTQGGVDRQSIAQLHRLQVFQNLIIEQG